MENQKLKNTKVFIFAIASVFIIGFGIFLRTELYLHNALFGLDEVMLSLSFADRGINALFLPLEAQQKAPPFFLCFTYFIIKISGFNELSFRFIPYISGCLSVTAFYFLINICVQNKAGRIFGLFLFAVSAPLVYNSAEFKPYSVDVLMCLLLFLFYNFIYTGKYSFLSGQRKISCVLYALITILLIFTSFPSAFIILSMTVSLCIIKKRITPASCSVIAGVLTASFIAYKTDAGNVEFLRSFWWYDGKNIPSMYLNSVKYFLCSTHNYICYAFAITAVAGFIKLFRDKKEMAFPFAFCIIIPVITNTLKLYPFEERLVLYILPVCLTAASKVFDFSLFNKNKTVHYLFLGISLLVLLHIKIPFVNLPYDKLIDYRRQGDRTRALEYRQEMKNFALFILNNYSGEKILATNEFKYFTDYYNKYYGMNKNIPIVSLGYDESIDVNDILAGFINENEKNKMWFFSRIDECYFIFFNMDDVTELLNLKHIKYDIMLSGIENGYLIYTL